MTLSARVLRMALALSTVWCLGCEAFDTILERDDAREDAIASTSSTTPVVAASGDHDADADCHCVNGHGGQVVTLPLLERLALSPGEYVAPRHGLIVRTQPPPVPPPIA